MSKFSEYSTTELFNELIERNELDVIGKFISQIESDVIKTEVKHRDNLALSILDDSTIITDSMIVEAVTERGISDEISDLDDFTNSELIRECEVRDIYPDENDIDYDLNNFSDDEIIKEYESRGLSLLDLDLSLHKANRHAEFLEQLERLYPIELAGITRKKLVDV